MDGRAFLDVAEELSRGATEAHWRAAVGRAYYALMLEGRDLLHRWGFDPPPRDNVHSFVRLRLLYAADMDLKRAGRILERLVLNRNLADYQLDLPGEFASATRSIEAIRAAGDAISWLDQVNDDPSAAKRRSHRFGPDGVATASWGRPYSARPTTKASAQPASSPESGGSGGRA